MSIKLSPNIPANVVEIGQEVTQGVVDALNGATSPDATNVFLTRANSFNTADAAVRITQTGAGEAFRVEDDTSPDSTAFVIAADGRVGVGGSADAAYALRVYGGSSIIAGGIVGTIGSSNSAPIGFFTQNGNGGGVTITNTGTGNSFVVNDESGDTTPFVIDASGRVCVGTATPVNNANLTVAGGIGVLAGRFQGQVQVDTTNNTTALQVENFSTTGGAAIFRSAGSLDAVRITNTGTGNSFVVEDEANPDATPFVVDALGNVGIGRSATARKLEVLGNAAITGVTTLEASGASGALSITQLSGAGVALTIQNNGTGNSLVVNDDTADASPFIIDAAGNVGIGVTSTASKLEVIGKSYFRSNVGGAGNPVFWVRQENTGATATALTVTNEGTGNSFVVEDSAGDTTPFIIDNAGNVTLGGTIQFNSEPAVSSLTYKTTGLATNVDRTDFPNEVEIIIGGVTYRIPARQV